MKKYQVKPPLFLDQFFHMDKACMPVQPYDFQESFVYYTETSAFEKVLIEQKRKGEVLKQ